GLHGSPRWVILRGTSKNSASGPLASLRTQKILMYFHIHSGFLGPPRLAIGPLSKFLEVPYGNSGKRRLIELQHFRRQGGIEKWRGEFLSLAHRPLEKFQKGLPVVSVFLSLVEDNIGHSGDGIGRVSGSICHGSSNIFLNFLA